MLKKIPYDKKLHFLVCFAITMFCYPFIGWWSIAVAVIAAVGKEVRDKISYGNFSWSDILADCIGITAGIAILALIKLFV